MNAYDHLTRRIEESRERYRRETRHRRLGYARECRSRARRTALAGGAFLGVAIVVAILAPSPAIGFPLFGLGVGLLVGTRAPLSSARRWEYLADNPDYTPSSW